MDGVESTFFALSNAENPHNKSPKSLDKYTKRQDTLSNYGIKGCRKITSKLRKTMLKNSQTFCAKNDKEIQAKLWITENELT